jgi:hypothetical protein
VINIVVCLVCFIFAIEILMKSQVIFLFIVTNYYSKVVSCFNLMMNLILDGTCPPMLVLLSLT